MCIIGERWLGKRFVHEKKLAFIRAVAASMRTQHLESHDAIAATCPFSSRRFAWLIARWTHYGQQMDALVQVGARCPGLAIHGVDRGSRSDRLRVTGCGVESLVRLPMFVGARYQIPRTVEKAIR